MERFYVHYNRKLENMRQPYARKWVYANTWAVLAQNSAGVGHFLHQPLHRRVHFLRSPKPEKFQLHTDLHFKSIISRVANSVMG